MASSILFVFFFLLLIFAEKAKSQFLCKFSNCHGGDSTSPSVRFPFRLQNSQDPRCGYLPEFDLHCNNRNQTILNLPAAGDFVVERIDYGRQVLWIDDPDECLTRRLMEKPLDLQSSPFQIASGSVNFTFFNCSSSNDFPYGFEEIKCMSGENFTVAAIATRDFPRVSASLPAACQVFATMRRPVTKDSFEAGMALRWIEPFCANCEARGGDCSLKGSSSVDVECYNLPKSGLPRGAKYGLIIGVGIPGFLFLFGLGCYICGKFKAFARPNRPIANSFSMGHQPSILVAGLDGPTIQSFPKTVLGQSRRLPKPNDNTCSICLSEYQPKETIRTIPECSHYFHVNCIDEWLKLNATCPVCRASPEESPVTVIPSSSVSMSSTTSSTLSRN